MFLGDFIEKVLRVSKALTRKSPAYGHDYRFEAAHHPQRYRGQHRIDYETCIGCDSCNKICPVHAITMKKLPFKKKNIVPEVNLSVCIFCGLCEDVCPTKPKKSILLSGGRYDMLTGGWHENQEDFWVHVDIPEAYIKSRLEEEEAARVAKEMKQKKLEAQARAKAKTQNSTSEEKKIPNQAPNGAPDFSKPAFQMDTNGPTTQAWTKEEKEQTQSPSPEEKKSPQRSDNV